MTHPLNAGNRCWLLSQVKLLKSMGHDVSLVAVYKPGFKKHNQIETELDLTSLYWGKKLFVFKEKLVDHILKKIILLFRKVFCNGMFKCDDMYPMGLSSYLNKINDVENFDILIVNYYWLSKALSKSKIPKKGIFTHDCFSFKNILGGKNAWMSTTPNEESKALMRCEHIFALQEEEKIFFKHLAPLSKVYNIFCSYHMHQTDVCGNHNIVFLSGNNQYNINGLIWFIDEVFKKIKIKFEDAKLIVCGSICKHFHSDNPGIVFLGYVEDPIDLYKLGDIAINPCYEGTGLKIKTFEAISYDKITLVHPHSLVGIYKSTEAPLFSSANGDEWVSFISSVWTDNQQIIYQYKNKNRNYIKSLNNYISDTYSTFID